MEGGGLYILFTHIEVRSVQVSDVCVPVCVCCIVYACFRLPNTLLYMHTCVDWRLHQPRVQQKSVRKSSWVVRQVCADCDGFAADSSNRV